MRKLMLIALVLGMCGAVLTGCKVKGEIDDVALVVQMRIVAGSILPMMQEQAVSQLVGGQRIELREHALADQGNAIQSAKGDGFDDEWPPI